MLIRCCCHELVDARRGDSYHSPACLAFAATAGCGKAKTQRLWAEKILVQHLHMYMCLLGTKLPEMSDLTVLQKQILLVWSKLHTIVYTLGRYYLHTQNRPKVDRTALQP